jgi:hypothetical protein
MDDTLRKWLPWIGGAAVLLVIVAVFALTRGDGDDAAATTTDAGSTTSLATTTVADTTIPPTTVPPTTVPPTTAPPTTLPPTTLPPTTLPPTTVPDTSIPEPAIGELVLETDGVGSLGALVDFGTNDEVAVAEVTAALGPNTEDSGWIPSFSGYGTCPGDEVRGVEWGSFVMLFTNADTAFATGGARHFFSYYYTEPAQPDFATPEMIEIGSTVAQLKAAYEGPDFVFTEFEFDPSLGHWTYDHDFDAQTLLWGITTGFTDGDLVMSINGGIGCGE